jgi:hypothetical protein
MKRADVVSVRNLFSGRSRFRVGSVRRAFVWGPTEVAQLLVDLENGAAIEPDDDLEERFYLGPITVSRARGGAYLLHDGQQRLVVISMALAFARDRVNDPRARLMLDNMLVRRSMFSQPEPRLRLAPEDHAWFAHFILPPGATMRIPQQAPVGSPTNLLLAARFMEQAFEAYSIDDLHRMIEFMALHTAVVRSVADVELEDAPQLAAPDAAVESHYRIAAE